MSNFGGFMMSWGKGIEQTMAHQIFRNVWFYEVGKPEKGYRIIGRYFWLKRDKKKTTNNY